MHHKIAFYKNNKYVRQIFEADVDNALTMNIVFAILLKKGDEVRLNRIRSIGTRFEGEKRNIPQCWK